MNYILVKKVEFVDQKVLGASDTTPVFGTINVVREAAKKFLH